MMGAALQRREEMSLPKREVTGNPGNNIVPILGLSKDLSNFVFDRAREVLTALELGIKAEEWADVLGVTDRWVRMWKSGLKPVHKRYILSIARAAQEYCKRARARIDSIQEWAEQVVIMSAVDGFKEGK